MLRDWISVTNETASIGLSAVATPALLVWRLRQLARTKRAKLKSAA